MKLHSDENIEKFRNAAVACFKPLAERYGLPLVATGLTEYSIPMKELTARIQLIPGHLPNSVVAFFFNDPQWLTKSPLRTQGVSLLEFVHHRDADFNFTDPRLSNREQIDVKMAFLAELFAKYCDSLLRGDLCLWNVVSKKVEDELAQK